MTKAKDSLRFHVFKCLKKTAYWINKNYIEMDLNPVKKLFK